MATEGVFNGTDMVVLVDGVVLGHTTSCTLSVEADLPDASTKDSAGWAEHIKGQRSWSVDFEGLMAYDGSIPSPEVLDYILNRTTVTLRFSTQETGDAYWTGSASLASYEISAEMESPTSASGSFTGNGALSKATN